MPITMTFDECVPYPFSYADTEVSSRSSNWIKRSLNVIKKVVMDFAIVQGGIHKELEKVYEELSSMDFDECSGLKWRRTQINVRYYNYCTSNLPVEKPGI